MNLKEIKNESTQLKITKSLWNYKKILSTENEWTRILTSQGGPPREAGNHATNQTVNHAWKWKDSS